MQSLQKQMYQIAVEHGWWEAPLIVAEKIALMHSELSEALEHYRNGNENFKLEEIWFSKDKPDGFAIELADCVIRIMDLCEHLNIDLEEAIKVKAKYNETRPYKHGNKLI